MLELWFSLSRKIEGGILRRIYFLSFHFSRWLIYILSKVCALYLYFKNKYTVFLFYFIFKCFNWLFMRKSYHRAQTTNSQNPWDGCQRRRNPRQAAAPVPKPPPPEPAPAWARTGAAEEDSAHLEAGTDASLPAPAGFPHSPSSAAALPFSQEASSKPWHSGDPSVRTQCPPPLGPRPQVHLGHQHLALSVSPPCQPVSTAPPSDLGTHRTW